MSNSRGSRWLAWLIAGAALVTMLVLSLVLRAQENEGKAWPITHAVVARLATDAGARDLYAKNPRLADSYPTAEAFVTAVAAQRNAFGSLPNRQPSPEAFRADSDPDSLSIAAKGSGGAWMELNVERSDGSAAGHAAIGEGITFLGFGADESALANQRKSISSAVHEARWAAFRSVEQSLLTDAGVEALLQANPDLAKDETERGAFLKQAQAWRPRLAAHEPPTTWKAAVDDDDELVSMQHRSGAPFGEQLVVGWRLKDRQTWFRATWEEGRLKKVTLGD